MCGVWVRIAVENASPGDPTESSPGAKSRHERVAIEVAGFHIHRDTWSAYGAMSMLG
jgi:hypothetical protein